MVASFEYIQQVFENYDKATQANWDIPARQGNVIVVWSRKRPTR